MKKNKNRSIELDLTSFIDVIFVILIAFIIIYSSRSSGSAEPTPAPVINPMDNVITLGLIVEYNDENVKSRTIQLVSEPEMTIEPFDTLEGENEEAFYSLQEQITKIVDENPDVPILLNAYEDKILYRDHRRIEEINDSLKTKGNYYPSWKTKVTEESTDADMESNDGQ